MEAHSMSKRQEAYKLWLTGMKKSIISRQLGIDYDTLLGWTKRFEAEGASGTSLRYNRCGSRGLFSEAVHEQALALRRAHPDWGASYIQLHLQQQFEASQEPSVRQLQRWLGRAGLLTPATRLPRDRSTWASKPLERVQVDAKEQLRTADDHPCCYLNFTDEHSGAVLDAFVFPL
jgi:transposase